MANDVTEFKTGAEIDCYKILQKLGQGGMGVVYKVLAPDNNVYALKIMLNKETLGQDAVERFKMEVTALSRIEHSNIVKIYGVGVWCGSPYFVMDYLNGISLGKYIKTKKNIDYKEALQIGWRIALALSSIHKIKIIHRDIKPDNIILVEGKPYLMDFSIARTEKKDPQQVTATGVIIGTVNYMPLEQAKGDQSKIGPWSDIYALGATLFHVLTGKPPFDSSNNLEVLLRLSQEKLPSVRKYVPQIPKEVDWILQKATEKNIEDRYQSAELFASDLRAVLHHKKISIRHTTEMVKVRKDNSQAKAFFYCIILFLLVVVWMWINSTNPETQNGYPDTPNQPTSLSPTNPPVASSPQPPLPNPPTNPFINIPAPPIHPPTTPPPNTPPIPVPPHNPPTSPNTPPPFLPPNPPHNLPPSNIPPKPIDTNQKIGRSTPTRTILENQNGQELTQHIFSTIPLFPLPRNAKTAIPQSSQQLQQLQQEIASLEQDITQSSKKDAENRKPGYLANMNQSLYDAKYEKIGISYYRLAAYFQSNAQEVQTIRSYWQALTYLDKIQQPTTDTLLVRMACYAQAQQYAHLRRDIDLLQAKGAQYQHIVSHYSKCLDKVAPLPRSNANEMTLWQIFHILSYAHAHDWDFEHYPHLFPILQHVYQCSQQQPLLISPCAYLQVLVLLQNGNLSAAKMELQKLSQSPEYTTSPEIAEFVCAIVALHSQQINPAKAYFEAIENEFHKHGGFRAGNESLGMLRRQTYPYLEYWKNNPQFSNQLPPDSQKFLVNHLDMLLGLFSIRILNTDQVYRQKSDYTVRLALLHHAVYLEIGFIHLYYTRIAFELYYQGMQNTKLAECCMKTALLLNSYPEAFPLLREIYLKNSKPLQAKECLPFYPKKR